MCRTVPFVFKNPPPAADIPRRPPSRFLSLRSHQSSRQSDHAKENKCRTMPFACLKSTATVLGSGGFSAVKSNFSRWDSSRMGEDRRPPINFGGGSQAKVPDVNSQNRPSQQKACRTVPFDPRNAKLAHFLLEEEEEWGVDNGRNHVVHFASEEDVISYEEPEEPGNNYNWWYKPANKMKLDFPYPTSGFIRRLNNSQTLQIYSPRLGWIERPDEEERDDRPFAYFRVNGPNDFDCWEYTTTPSTFLSLKPLPGQNKPMECRVFGIMSAGSRENPGSWLLWNDQIGLIKCQNDCAKTLKKKNLHWQPTLQIVEANCIFVAMTCKWEVVKVTEVALIRAHQRSYLPRDAIYLNDLEALPLDQQRNINSEILFTSKTLGSTDAEIIHARMQHVIKPSNGVVHGVEFGALVIADFAGTSQLRSRAFHALVVAPVNIWNTRLTGNDLGKPDYYRIKKLFNCNTIQAVAKDPNTLPWPC